jgi:hypothetical protein
MTGGKIKNKGMEVFRVSIFYFFVLLQNNFFRLSLLKNMGK